MGTPLSKLTIKGFKSIRALEDFELRPLNVLIGPNGSGKSNFVSFFDFFRQLVNQSLQPYVLKKGGADALLFFGPKVTHEMLLSVYSGAEGYEARLQPTTGDHLLFTQDAFLHSSSYAEEFCQQLGSGHLESKLKAAKDKPGDFGADFRAAIEVIWNAIANLVTYHFHDTSDFATVRRPGTTRDYEHLQPDAANLAAFLLRLRGAAPTHYRQVVDAIRLVAPFFDDFKLRPQASGNDTTVWLEWTQRGSDYPFHPSQLSDGTLRFACLATALLQPNPPSTILLDEPELGLHPHALAILADLVKQAATKTQVILCTQSASLVDYFEPEDIVVLDREKEATAFRRLDAKQLRKWLKKYTLGELWRKDFLQEGPSVG